ncbi:MAG TPA: SH3-like domain-containing protein, partial [Ilumatobacteraceae bacterium]
GRIESVCGDDRLPEMNSAEHTGAVYTVEFSSHQLWGETTEPAFTVLVDLWEHYLEPVPLTDTGLMST